MEKGKIQKGRWFSRGRDPVKIKELWNPIFTFYLSQNKRQGGTKQENAFAKEFNQYSRILIIQVRKEGGGNLDSYDFVFKKTEAFFLT